MILISPANITSKYGNDPIHDLLHIIDPMYLLYTFETKLLTITHIECINYNKLLHIQHTK